MAAGLRRHRNEVTIMINHMVILFSLILRVNTYESVIPYDVPYWIADDV